MNRLIKTITAAIHRIVAPCLAMTFALACGGVAAQSLVDISNTPLYGARQVHPNVVVATSVEFPTVGAAYLNVRYARTNTYLGYFNSLKCYSYSGNSGGYFYITGAADSNHECSSQFSGNWLNWITMSAIDEFRYAMTGGNRVDENGPNNGTIVQRAYLPDGSINGVPSFYASGNFPAHAIGANGYLDGYPSSRTSAVTPASPSNDNIVVYIYNCKSQLYFGSSYSGDCNNPVSDYGTLNVRVLVCDDTEGPTRPDLCLQYGGPTGHYKPVGQTQVNASRMRFAAFGYLMDRDIPASSYSAPCNDSGWNRCRYGGVLRAPMKYVGPTTYDANQTPFTNTRTEINANGSLINDPEQSNASANAASAGGSYSGFINYINKFGASGVYKRFDPAGEMFYEAIRYYQNLQPTSLAVQGISNNGIKDYFPVTTTWTDPIQSSCSANYIINLSDANTWDDTYLPGNPGSPGAGYGRPSTRPAEGGLDAYLWTGRIAALESGTSSITTNDVRSGLSNIQNQNTGASGASYAVAGAAFWANTSDIRSDLPGKQTIKTISFDVGEPSIDVHDRQLYLMGKYGGFNNTIDRPTDAFSNPFWGTDPANPSGSAIRTNFEWEDSTGSAYPANYLLASDPQKLINGLRAAFARINAQTGTLAGAALTSANLTYGSAGAYIATFDPARWAGSVLFNSLSVDPVTGNLVVSSSPIWDAGALLNARCGTVSSGSTTCTDLDLSANKRNIVTTVISSGQRVAVPFTYADIASRDSTYTQFLNTNPATGSSDGSGPQRLNYLRGYRADEASSLGFRGRDSAMGDIINSGPVYVGPPSAAVSDLDYQSFFSTNSARTPAVYVGGNDGMLHGIRASDGFELFAYIPQFASPDLNALTNAGYTHDVFVDTVPKVQEAKLGSTWKTVLVGANGNGAQGMFGLDVTDPATFGPSKVLFEFSDMDDPDFGSTLAAPEIAKLWVSGTAAAPVFRYFAVVTGYNNRRTTVNGRTDSQVSSQTLNQGVLFLIALDHTLGTPWVQNTDYYKFKFPASNTSLPNGLGPVALLASKSGDRSTSSMYFGDLQGNLWKFNTATGNPSTWSSALGTSAAPLPIFVAKDAADNRQPITARVELANGPFGSTLIFLGTGEYLGTGDLTLPGSVQSEYALLDVNPSVLITRSSDLVPRTAAVGPCPPSVTGVCLNVTGAAFSYSGASAKKGWYLDFPGSASVGERSVTKPAVRTGLLTFTTLTLSNDLCLPGNGNVYQVNALTGLAIGGAGATIGYTSTVGIPGPPRVVDLTITPGATRASGEVMNRKTQTTIVSGTSGKIASYGGTTPVATQGVLTSNVPPQGPPTQRLNWREITNWNDRVGN